MSPSQVPAPGFTLSPKNEEDRKKWTEELDRRLPGYKQSKSEIGRILKELKAVYGRPGCRGHWQSFLRSRGLAVSTANGLIRRFIKESSMQRDGGEAQSLTLPRPKQPAATVTLRLPIALGQRDEFRSAVAKLGLDRAAELVFTALTRAVAQPDPAKCSEEAGIESRNALAAEAESAESGRFQEVGTPLHQPGGPTNPEPNHEHEEVSATVLSGNSPDLLQAKFDQPMPKGGVEGAVRIESAESGRFQEAEARSPQSSGVVKAEPNRKPVSAHVWLGDSSSPFQSQLNQAMPEGFAGGVVRMESAGSGRFRINFIPYSPPDNQDTPKQDPAAADGSRGRHFQLPAPEQRQVEVSPRPVFPPVTPGERKVPEFATAGGANSRLSADMRSRDLFQKLLAVTAADAESFSPEHLLLRGGSFDQKHQKHQKHQQHQIPGTSDQRLYQALYDLPFLAP